MNKSVIVLLILVGLVLIAIGPGQWSLARTVLEGGVPEASPAEPAGGRVAGLGASIESRPVDPAGSRPLEWLGDGVDPARMRDLVREATSFRFALQRDYAAYGHLDGWNEGYIDDTELGHEILACRLEHELRQKAACGWGQALVLRREGDRGVVRYTQVRGRDLTPECRAWMQCVAGAYRGESVAWPSDSDLGDELVLKGGVMNHGADAFEIDDHGSYIEFYRGVFRQAAQHLREVEDALAKEGPLPPILHARRRAERELADAEAMLRALGADP